MIEMIVVSFIIALFAALITPNYVNMMESQKRRAFYTSVVDMAGKAREWAITRHATVYIQADSSGNSMVAKQESNDSNYQALDGNNSAGPQTMGSSSQTVDTNPQTNMGTAPADRSNDKVQTTLPLPTGMQFGNFQIAGASSDASTWKIRFFPDGTSDGGAVELTDKGFVKSLVVNTKAGVSLVDGTIPDTSQISWIAGTYVQRQQ